MSIAEATLPQTQADAASPVAETSPGPPDVASGNLDEVLAAAERGEYNPEAQEARATEAARETSPDRPQPAAPTATPAEAPADRPEEQVDYRRKYESVSGNNYQLSQQVQTLQQQIAEQQATFQREQQLARLEWEQAQREQALRYQIPDQSLAEEAVRESRRQHQEDLGKRNFQETANQYAGYLGNIHQQQQQQWAQLRQSQLGLFQQSLAQRGREMAQFVAERTDAPAEVLAAMVESEAFASIFPMIGTMPAGVNPAERDMELVMRAMAAAGQAAAKADSQRRATNGQRAAADGTFRSDPEGGTRTSGLTASQHYAQMPEKEFNAAVERLTAEAYARRG
jgi:hypothetical protein